MQKTQIIYKGSKPKDSEIKELMMLMPHVQVIYNRYINENIKTVIDPIYKIETLDWVWFRSLFDSDNDISCLVLEPTDLMRLGITKHWGFYSFDGDTDHEFYMTNLGSKLDPRAKANGFSSNFVWMFCHEYLHGTVWGNTRNRELAASLVHQWEDQGILKQKIAEEYELYVQLLNVKVSLFQRLLTMIGKKKPKLPIPMTLVTQKYGQYNPVLYPATKYHWGLDIKAPIKTPIKAPLDGGITQCGYSESLGYWMEFKMSDGKYMIVLHLAELPKKGLYTQDAVIGILGNTGAIQGVHFHIEIWKVPMTDRVNQLKHFGWNITEDPAVYFGIA